MRRWLLRGLVVVVLVAGTAGYLLWSAGRAAPSWYRPPDPADDQAANLADRVEYRLVEETQKIRAADLPWTLRVRQEQVNAWLAIRLPQWIAREHEVPWPQELGTPQVSLEADHVSLALPVGRPGHRRVLVAEIQPEVRGEELFLQLQAVRLGRLRLGGDPVQAIMQLIEESGWIDRVDRAAVGQAVDLLTGRQPLDTRLTLTDGRTVRLLDVHCHEGALDLTSRTIGKESD